MLPDFLIIGQAKAGTTSLNRYLGQHPYIYMPPVKESRYFSYYENNPKHRKGVPKVFRVTTLEDYERLFEGAEQGMIIGEASPDYINSTTAAARIESTIPSVKIIATLRNKADQMYSLYQMHVRAGIEKRPFITAFREDVDKWWVKSSFTYVNLKRYYDLFDHDRIKIIIFDDFVVDAKATVCDVFRFLGVREEIGLDVSKRYNTGGAPRNKVLYKGYKYLRRHRKLFERMKRAVSPRSMAVMRSILEKSADRMDPLSLEDRRFVLEYYREDTMRLEELIGRTLPGWLP